MFSILFVLLQSSFKSVLQAKETDDIDFDPDMLADWDDICKAEHLFLIFRRNAVNKLERVCNFQNMSREEREMSTRNMLHPQLTVFPCENNHYKEYATTHTAFDLVVKEILTKNNGIFFVC